jgi:hypothetical protein
LVEVLRHKIREVPGLISGRILGSFQVTSYFCPHSVALGSTQILTEMSTRELPWGKARPVRGADSSAVLVVPNVKVRVEAERFVALLSLHDFLQESFFNLLKPSGNFTYHHV